MRRHVKRVLLVLALAGPMSAGTPARADAPEPADLPGLETMIGQMLMVGYYGTRANEPGVLRVARQIERGQIGGVIVMDRNVRSRREMREVTSLFARAPAALPPLIAVDQEGGAVQRLSAAKGFRAYPSARRLAQGRGPLRAYYVYRAMARELAAAGFNLNLGPVVDLDRNAANQVIGRRGRSFGAQPERVAAYAMAFVAAHRHAGVLTSAKHFPGHGSSAADSHHGFVDLTRTWSERELDPYRALASERAIDTVMMGHLFHPSFGERRQPATFAPRAIAWLRHAIGFDGVVITDDLGMGAIRQHHSLEESLVRAVAAGNDILLLCNNIRRPDFPEYAIGTIRRAVETGRVPVENIVASYRRIVALKATLREPSAAAPEPTVIAD